MKNGLSFQENFLLLSTNGIIKNNIINIVGSKIPDMNLSTPVRRNAYSDEKYHSGTVIPGGTLGSNLIPNAIGNKPATRLAVSRYDVAHVYK